MKRWLVRCLTFVLYAAVVFSYGDCCCVGEAEHCRIGRFSVVPIAVCSFPSTYECLVVYSEQGAALLLRTSTLLYPLLLLLYNQGSSDDVFELLFMYVLVQQHGSWTCLCGLFSTRSIRTIRIVYVVKGTNKHEAQVCEYVSCEASHNSERVRRAPKWRLLPASFVGQRSAGVGHLAYMSNSVHSMTPSYA